MRMIIEDVFWKEAKEKTGSCCLVFADNQPTLYYISENVGFMLSWTKVATNKDRFSFMREKRGNSTRRVLGL